MTASPIPSHRKPPLDVNAIPLLPTYEQSQPTNAESESPLSPPEKTAFPAEIQAFLAHLLVTKRGLTSDHASRIGSKWTIGNGKELRSYKPAMYFDIFGREDGWVVYKEAKLCIALDEKGKEEKTPIWRDCKCTWPVKLVTTYPN